MQNQHDDRYEKALAGQYAEEFMVSPLGEKLVEIISDHEKDAIEQLINGTEEEQKEARRTIDMTRGLAGYLQAIITEGQIALQQLEQDQSHD